MGKKRILIFSLFLSLFLTSCKVVNTTNDEVILNKENASTESIKSIYNDNMNQIISIGGHHLSCIIFRNNQFRIEDIWDCSEWCVGNYWCYKVMN